MTSQEQEIIETKIAVRNNTSQELLLYLEPWAEEIKLGMQNELIIVGRGPEKGNGFSVDYNQDSIVITGWTGSVVHVFCGGKEIGDGAKRPPVPDFD